MPRVSAVRQSAAVCAAAVRAAALLAAALLAAALLATPLLPPGAPGSPAPASAQDVSAAAVGAPFTQWSVSGFSQPTAMAVAPDGRVLVAEQAGAIRIVDDGQIVSPPAIDLAVDSNGERGLIGIALDPAFVSNGFVYVHYTVPGSPPHNRVSRLTLSGNNIVGGSEAVLLDLPGLSSATNHNGGAIHFVPDGTLLVAVGENADASRAQQLTNPFGKILRINRDGSIPSTNPFFASTSGINRAIWAYGLRNPFTVAVLPAAGRIHVNDVGAGSFEEINEANRAGLNFGWPTTEGPTTDPRFVSPGFAYGHQPPSGPTTGCAITSAAFYDTAVAGHFPADFEGDYFFGDLCSGWIRRFDPVSRAVNDFAVALGAPVDAAVGPSGSLFVLGRGGPSGVLYEFGISQRWFLRDSASPGPAQRTFVQGYRGSRSIACDWNGDGVDTAASFAAGSWIFSPGGTVAPRIVSFGTVGDRPVCGDWDGDGDDTIGVFQHGHFYLRNSNTPGPPDHAIAFGTPADDPVAGDWDGDGDHTIGVYQNGWFFLRDSLSPGPPNRSANYGRTQDGHLAGDWDNDGDDTIGVFQHAFFYLRNSVSAGPPDVAVQYGSTTDQPVTGRFDGAGGDGVGITLAL